MLFNIDEWVQTTRINGDLLQEITSPGIKTSTGAYDPRGLFSVDIFGQEKSSRWRTMYAYIKLAHPVLHPAIMYIITRRISGLLKWINLECGAFEQNGQLVLTDSPSSYTFCGLEALYHNPKRVLDLLRSHKLLATDVAEAIAQKLINDRKVMFTKYVIVIPPQFRMDQDDNTLYSRILSENTVAYSSLTSTHTLMKNRAFTTVQNLYEQLFEAYIEKVKGKFGMIRTSLVAKSVDFSARAVITGDPNIRPYELGVPRDMLVKMFYPWIINYILTHPEISRELSQYTEVNKPALYTLLNVKLQQEAIDERILDILYKIVAIIAKDKVILAKRDPVLHRLSIRGYIPVPIDSTTFHISPMVCPGHNADFDGDQMGIFLPLTKEAQDEAKKKMLSIKSIYHPMSGLSLSLERDFVLGIYFLTKDDASGSPTKYDDSVDLVDVVKHLAKDFDKPVIYRGRQNTMGRRAIEVVFEDKVQITEPITGKKLEAILEKFSGDPKWLADCMFVLEHLGGYASSLVGGSMSISDFVLPDDLEKRKVDVLNNPDKYDVQTELQKITDEYLARTTAQNQYSALIIKSGARGSAEQIMQMSVAKGYISDIEGRLISKPIKSNFARGLNPTDLFMSGSGSRKGTVDRSQNTSKSGYLSRQLVYLMASIRAGNIESCGTDRFFEVKLTNDNAKLFMGRVLKNGDTLTPEYIKQKNLVGTFIQLYTPMYCRSRTLCKRCFPDFYRQKINNVSNIGIVAAQIVGERASQLTMRTFHCNLKSSMVYYKYKDHTALVTFDYLYNEVFRSVREVEGDGQLEKHITGFQVWDRDRWTNVVKLIRHKKMPGTAVRMLATKTGRFTITQDNHPHMLKRLNETEYNPTILETDRMLCKQYTVDTSLPEIFDDTHPVTPKIDAYMLGMAVSKNLTIPVECGGADIADVHLPFDFIRYTDADLAQILCGVIDGGGTHVYYENEPVICISSLSSALIHQVSLIAEHFGIRVSVETTYSIRPSVKQGYILTLYPQPSHKYLFNRSTLMQTYEYTQHENRLIPIIRSYDRINFNNDEYLYDATTETGTLTVNGIWTHNTGGAAKVYYIKQDLPEIEEFLFQEGLDLTAKKEISIEVIDAVMENVSTIVGRTFSISAKNNQKTSFETSVNIEFNTESATFTEHVGSTYRMLYQAGTPIGGIESTATDVTSAVLNLQAMLNKTSDIETPELLVQELYDILKIAVKIPFIYLEMVISQLIRDPDHIQFPYRLGSMKKPATHIGIKTVAGIENPIRGILFEHVTDVIINTVLGGGPQGDLLTSDFEEIYRW